MAKKTGGRKKKSSRKKVAKTTPKKAKVKAEPAQASLKPKQFKDTSTITVSKKIINQIIGQDAAAEVVKKAAKQRRHILLIGEPGTGKSMLGMALAELIPKEKLVDIVSFSNPNDENQPLIRTVPAGEGRSIVMQSKLKASGIFRNQNIFIFILVIIAMIAPWWARRYYNSDIIFAALFIGGIIFLAAFIVFLNLGKRLPTRDQSPKVIVDNFDKKKALFYDATGAHAGALLGDVLHDPFQTFFPSQVMTKINKSCFKPITMNTELNKLFQQNKQLIETRKEKNYEAIHLPKNTLKVLGATNKSISPVEVISSNRYDYNGEMIKLTTSENKEIIVTPEHKIAVWKEAKIEYIEARNIQKDDEVVAKSEDIIIDEQDIINTYDKRQQEQCKLYYQYLSIKSKNHSWGYKRIAKVMNQPEGKTRWWHANKHIPVPIQTANWLKETGLIPLKIDNSKLQLISKVLGATFGDGGIFENLNGIFLSSSEKESVKEFGKDIETIFNLEKNTNSRIIEGGEYGHSWCYQNTNRNVIRFFIALGSPKGNKTNLQLKIPSWISLRSIFETEFYGSFLGGELCTPTIHKNGNYLTSLEVGITGSSQFKENRLYFLNQLKEHLRNNRINCTSIYEGKTKTEDSLVFRLLIEKKLDNVLLFLMNTKLNYCKYKQDKLYKALAQWAQLKKNKYYKLLERGYGAEHAMKTLNLTPNSLYLLLNHFSPEGEIEA